MEAYNLVKEIRCAQITRAQTIIKGLAEAEEEGGQTVYIKIALVQCHEINGCNDHRGGGKGPLALWRFLAK